MSEPTANDLGAALARVVPALEQVEGVRMPAPSRRECPVWWRRRELNPRPKQRHSGSLRACPGFCSYLAAPPDGIRFCQPRWVSRLRAVAPLWRQSGLFDAAPRSAGLTGGNARDLSPGDQVLTAYAARARPLVLLAFVNACAVSLAALGSQSRSSTAPSRPDAPTKLPSVAIQILPSGCAIHTLGLLV